MVGLPNPPLGLANGDTLSGGLVTGASDMPSQPVAPGRYSIEQGMLAGSPNYSLLADRTALSASLNAKRRNVAGSGLPDDNCNYQPHS